MNISQDLYTAATIRRLERAAIDDAGIPGIELMSRAGAAAFAVLRGRWPAARTIGVATGPGNNAGDGFVVARLAARAGLVTRVAVLGDESRLGPDAESALLSMREQGGCEETALAEALDGVDVIVDALFGIGLGRDLEGRFADAVATVNAADAPVLAIDVPSGLDADTGAVRGAAVRAECTITFIGSKRGLHTGRAREFVGDVVCDSIGLDTATLLPGRPVDAGLVDTECFRGALGARARDAHKGRFGHVLVLGGDRGLGGAARLAGEAAVRCGAGLVTVATRAEHVAPILAARPELMARSVDGPDDLDDLPARATVIAIGPGLGRSSWGRALLGVAMDADAPCVVDADALNLLAAEAAAWPAANRSCVFTPHPGEAARLLGTSVPEIEADRFAACEALTRRHPGTWVLKGAGTIVVSAAASPRVCAGGNPGMAAGGMGDVLTGIVAALLAQGLTSFDAAAAAVCLHGAAADICARGGERGMVASDLFSPLRELVNRV